MNRPRKNRIRVGDRVIRRRVPVGPYGDNRVVVADAGDAMVGTVIRLGRPMTDGRYPCKVRWSNGCVGSVESHMLIKLGDQA